MLLTAPLFITWGTAIILATLNGQRSWVHWAGAVGLSAALVASLALLYRVYTGAPIEVVTGNWPQGIGIRLRADTLSMTFATLVDVLLLAALLYEPPGRSEERSFPALILFLAAGLNGLFLTGDIFDFYVFFEVSMTSSYILTSYGSNKRILRNTFSFIIINLVGSSIFLSGLLALYHQTGTLDMQQVAARISDIDPQTAVLSGVLILVAFSIKLGLFPFQYWLPPVYRGVKPVAAAILGGILVNVGSYGLLRFGGTIFPAQLQAGSKLLLVLGAASMIYGAILAIGRRTPQEVLAYSSISQAGYILIAVSFGGLAGFSAAIIYAIVNGLNKTMLFLASGVRGWLISFSFAVGALSVVGIPPTVGFFAKASLFRTAIHYHSPVFVVLVFLGGSLSFVYMFQLYQRKFWANSTEETQEASYVRQYVIVALALIILALGIWPDPLLSIGSQWMASGLLN